MISITINNTAYLKDPESSELGKKIICCSIDLIYEIGFETFTFKKLAKKIRSSEASIYRYFESKHRLLIYLSSWYWAWMEYKLQLLTTNIASPIDRMQRAINLITEEVKGDSDFSHIDELKLYGIVISESSKAYLTKDVDQANKDGAYLNYKSFVAKISSIVLEINKKYKYPQMLVTTVIEGAHQQRYFAQHLPRLTNKIKGKDTVCEFYHNLVFKALD